MNNWDSQWTILSNKKMNYFKNLLKFLIKMEITKRSTLKVLC